MLLANQIGTQIANQTVATIQNAYNKLQDAVNQSASLAVTVQQQAGAGTQEAQQAAENAYNGIQSIVNQALSNFNNLVNMFNQNYG